MLALEFDRAERLFEKIIDRVEDVREQDGFGSKSSWA